jgi:membrane protein implicated in regulation of membrane protease activity
VRQIPPEVFAMFRAQRLREAIPVRSLAWGGLAAGLSLALFLMVVLPFWWNVAAFAVSLGASYVAAANIANSLGDALGYRWGQRALEKRWQEFVRERDRSANIVDK